ncbi:MAG TPA: hypothetical protein VHJ78_11755, partial [Actinomycetota bacterium]|nr:hypothetical protein [Actinomycetota bacterium]
MGPAHCKKYGTPPWNWWSYIVASPALGTMYDHQFQGGVPYFLQWAGPMEAYEQIALERSLPTGENFGKNVE